MSDLVKVESQLPAKPEMFIQDHTVVKCMEKFAGVTTALQAYKAETVSIATLKKQYSVDWIRAYVAMWIVNVNDFLNVSRPMKDHQIEETAFLIVAKYYYLKVSDITLIFNRAKAGEFGPLFESLDGAKILSWFDKYSKERSEMIDDDDNRKAERFKVDNFKRSSDTTNIKALNKRARGFLEIEKAKAKLNNAKE